MTSNAFHDKVAVVTGGSTGIGYAAAQKIAEGGGTVYITGRDRDRLSAAASRIRGNVTGVQADSGAVGDLDRLFAEGRQGSGRLDVLVANAAAIVAASLGEISRDIITATFDVNVTGTIM